MVIKMEETKRLLYIIIKQLSHLNQGKGQTIGDLIFLAELERKYEWIK